MSNETSKIQSLLNLIGILVFDIDLPSGDITWTGDAKTILGLSIKDTHKQFRNINNYEEKIHPEDKERIISFFEKSVNEGGNLHVAFKQLSPNGKDYLNVQVSGEYSYNKEGKPYRLTGYIVDVAGRSDRELKIQRSEKAYRNLFESMQEGFAILQLEEGENGSQLIHKIVNPAYETLTWKSADKIIEQPLKTILPYMDNEVINSIKKVTRDRISARFEIYMKDLDMHQDIVVYSPEPNKVALIISDISKRKAAEEKIRFMAMHDNLTGLPNMVLAKDRLNMAIKSTKRDKKATALLFIDLDGFKKINDNYGHDAGDFLLIETGQRLKSLLREADTVARIGGDEFIVILPDIPRKSDAETVASKIIELVRKPVFYEGNNFHISASIGISLSPQNSVDRQVLLKKADNAMYKVKNSGKNAWLFAD